MSRSTRTSKVVEVVDYKATRVIGALRKQLPLFMVERLSGMEGRHERSFRASFSGGSFMFSVKDTGYQLCRVGFSVFNDGKDFISLLKLKQHIRDKIGEALRQDPCFKHVQSAGPYAFQFEVISLYEPTRHV